LKLYLTPLSGTVIVGKKVTENSIDVNPLLSNFLLTSNRSGAEHVSYKKESISLKFIKYTDRMIFI